ncbi:Nn.00g000630.m01.CDS01 [Neocucurbitaria sp. VM-36]
MQHHRTAPFPPPDVVPERALSAPPQSPPPLSSAPEFLIIGLFALRLTLRLIEGIHYYPGRDADIIWLADFLAPFQPQYALAKISGPRKNDYIATYQAIVSRMIKQPRYPVRFMQMNPDRSLQQERRGLENERSREMTDAERLDMIDFCDAASEWGSIVPLPAREANRMIELADQRQIADLSESRRLRDDGHLLRARGDRLPSRDDGHYIEVESSDFHCCDTY